MSGHNRWTQIKHQKGAADEKRGKLFSKLSALITAAAKGDPNPDFNPRLRAAVQKAKEANVPAENIARAIKRAGEAGGAVDELLLEAYGPGGVALIIEATTDNRNRTIPQVKKILSDYEGKWAESGSVRWAFAPPADLRRLNADKREQNANEQRWEAMFTQELSVEDRVKLAELVEALESHEDIQRVYTNAGN